MKLRIWIEDEPLSPDTETTMYLDVDLRGEWTLPQARALVLSFLQQAHDSLGLAVRWGGQAISMADPKVDPDPQETP